MTPARAPWEPPIGPEPGKPPPDGSAARAEQPYEGRPPAEADHVGEGPPTYDSEPTTPPTADPENLDDLVPDTVLDGARHGPMFLRSASLRGDSPRYRGEPRRDALLTARFGSGDEALLLVAVATGRRGTEGAHRAAADVCRWVGGAVGHSHARLAEDIRAGRRGALKAGLKRLTDRSYGRLRARAAELGLEPAAYTAQLHCLLLPAAPECRTRVFFGVGGGGLFRLRGGEWEDIEPAAGEEAGASRPAGSGGVPTGETTSLGPPADGLLAGPGAAGPYARDVDGDSGDVDGGDAAERTVELIGDRAAGLMVERTAGNVTGSPTVPAAAPATVSMAAPAAEPFRFRASVARPGDTLLLCSSGLAEPLREEPALADLLAERWSEPVPPGLAAFLADVQLRAKGYADDRTAAAVWEA